MASRLLLALLTQNLHAHTWYAASRKQHPLTGCAQHRACESGACCRSMVHTPELTNHSRGLMSGEAAMAHERRMVRCAKGINAPGSVRGRGKQGLQAGTVEIGKQRTSCRRATHSCHGQGTCQLHKQHSFPQINLAFQSHPCCRHICDWKAADLSRTGDPEPPCRRRGLGELGVGEWE